MFENMNLKIPAESAIQLFKRELFAAMAMQNLAVQMEELNEEDEPRYRTLHKKAAANAVAYADALIEELKKTK